MFFSTGNSIVGYISDVSPIKQARESKRKYFDFTLNTENSEERSVCFSPEKHKLISIIESEKSGCELKKFKKSDRDDILVTDYTSVKKVKLSFEMPAKQEVITEVATIKNECELMDVIDVCGIIELLGEKQTIELSYSQSTLPLQKAILQDNTGTIAVSFFGDLCDKVKSNKCYKITKLRIAKYMSERLLKTTEMSTITESSDTDIEPNLSDAVSDRTISGKIVGVDLRSLNSKTICYHCKADVDIDDDFATCHECGNMSLAEDCITKCVVSFTISSTDSNKHSRNALIYQ